MDDQYYYLLDGKEQGPFSRAAIDSLAANGALASALLRTGSDPTWRTAEEIGLSSIKASEAPKPKPAVDKYGFPIKEVGEPQDLASLQFRPRNTPKRSSSLGVILVLTLLGSVGFVLWITREGGETENTNLRMQEAHQAAQEAQLAADAANAANSVRSQPAQSYGDQECAAFAEMHLGPRPSSRDHPNCSQYWKDVTRLCRRASQGDYQARMIAPKIAQGLSRPYRTLQCGMWR